MKILVTGGAGFIGSNFILYWLKNHPQDVVVNLDNLTYAGNPENLTSVSTNKNYSFIKGDICNPSIVDTAMNGVDTVVNFAAESHVDRSIISPSIFIKTNVEGTQVVLDSALKNKVKRFHHISTDEVFGSLSLDDNKKFNEETNYNPTSPYAASKAGSDHIVRAYGQTYNLPYSITNCSNNFGPYQFPEKFIPLAIISLLTGKKVPIYGDGLYARDWLFVEDHVRAIDMILQSKNSLQKTYCVGGLTEQISNIDVVNKILKIMGKGQDSIEFVTDRPGHDRRYAIDWTKIKNEIGWAPQSDFDTYLEKTVNWYKENTQWWGNLIKNSDMRIHHG